MMGELIRRQLPVAAEGSKAGKEARIPFHLSASAIPLTDKVVPKKKNGKGNRRKRKGRSDRDSYAKRKERGIKRGVGTLKMTPEEDVLFQISRMVDGKYKTLSAFIADLMSYFVKATRFTVFIKAEENEERSQDEKKDGEVPVKPSGKIVLQHYCTVKLREDGRFKTENVDDEYMIMDGRSIQLRALREGKPSVFDKQEGKRIVFKNTDRKNKDYDDYEYDSGEQGMMAIVPFSYMGKTLGVVEVEGDLAIKGSLKTGLEKSAFAAAVLAAVGSQIGIMLKLKFDVTTRLKQKGDFKISLDDLVRKVYHGNLQKAYVLLIDLDNFKSMNTEFGYLNADEFLREAANQICESVRSEDRGNPEGDHDRRKRNGVSAISAARDVDNVYRWGGEEFAVLLENVTLKDATERGLQIIQKVKAISISAERIDAQVKTAAERIDVQVNAAAEKINAQVKAAANMKTTCSIGLVDIGVVTGELMKEKGFRGIRKCSDHVFSQCLELLQKAKNSGKNRLYVAEIHDGVLVPVEYKNGTRD